MRKKNAGRCRGMTDQTNRSTPELPWNVTDDEEHYGPTPRVFGLCLVKNEADIIKQTITHALKFCTKIFVFDNGSEDETGSIVKNLCRTNGNVELSITSPEPYTRGLRGKLFEKHRAVASDNDWWFILDGDEFLAQDPRPFLARATVAGESLVYTRQLEFRFTNEDWENWNKGIESIQDRKKSIFSRRRYYTPVNFEGRFFRSCSALEWSSFRNTPWVKGKICQQPMLNFHFPFRDPVQITQRIKSRAEVRNRSLRNHDHRYFSHVQSEKVEDYISSTKDLYYYDGQNCPYLAETVRTIPFPKREIMPYIKWKIRSLIKRGKE